MPTLENDSLRRMRVNIYYDILCNYLQYTPYVYVQRNHKNISIKLFLKKLAYSYRRHICIL